MVLTMISVIVMQWLLMKKSLHLKKSLCMPATGFMSLKLKAGLQRKSLITW
uniref:Uncharacterized protein n=1 Tax=Arundo donax TaxID=35708 RepID=A0A0A9E2R2_ARUDO